jgi:hypothetical protein
MGGLRPIGSEKLEGMDKIKRIMEIARYNENIPQAVNETKSTEYKISLADGNTYEIVKERQGYIIKQSINESETDYIEPMKNRKYFSSYSQALKRLNLMTKEINSLYENEEGTPLLGEQKKKFILKTKKKKSQEPKVEPSPEIPPAIPSEPAAPPAEPALPAEEPLPAPSDTAPEMGGEMTPMGEEPPMEDMPPMGEEPPMEDMPPMGDEEEIDTEVDVEEKPKEKKVSDLKRIQILVGKLAQKIRTYEETKDLTNKEVKYIINSILSAIDVDVLDEDDIEQIIDKLEGGNEEEDEKGGEEEEVSFEEENTDVIPEPPAEPEMGEGYDNFGDAFKDMFGGAYSSMATKKLTPESEDEFGDIDIEYPSRERRNRHFYDDKEVFTHGTFGESSVDKVLSKYFIINEEEEKEYQIKKERKTSLTYKQNKENIVRLSESAEQLDVALDYIRENPRVKLMGLSTKGNLIFKEGINEVKITKSGRII